MTAQTIFRRDRHPLAALVLGFAVVVAFTGGAGGQSMFWKP